MRRTKKHSLYFGCLLLFALSTATQGQEIKSDEAGLYTTDMLTLSGECKPGDLIEIRSASTLMGSLNIVIGEDDGVLVEYYKKARTDSKSIAIDYIDLISVPLTVTPNGVKLDLRAPNPAPWSSRESGLVEVQMTIPADCEVSIEAPYFDIEAEGPFKTFEVPSSMGRLTVFNVTDLLDLATSNRRVTVENISGKLKVVTTNSNLLARNINCSDEQALFRNDGGDIIIDNLTGELNIKNSYGRIEVVDFRPSGRKNYIRGLYGPIVVEVTEMTGGQLIVNNRYEDVEISLPEDISAVFSLAVEEEGKVEVKGFPFKTDLVKQNRLNLVAGNGDALVSSSIRGKGNIYVRGEDKGN